MSWVFRPQACGAARGPRCSRTAPYARDVRSAGAYEFDRYGTYNRETMRKPVVLVTGAGGEIGHALVARFAERDAAIITLDVNPLDRSVARSVAREFTGSICDT